MTCACHLKTHILRTEQRLYKHKSVSWIRNLLTRVQKTAWHERYERLSRRATSKWTTHSPRCSCVFRNALMHYKKKMKVGRILTKPSTVSLKFSYQGYHFKFLNFLIKSSTHLWFAEQMYFIYFLRKSKSKNKTSCFLKLGTKRLFLLTISGIKPQQLP